MRRRSSLAPHPSSTQQTSAEALEWINQDLQSTTFEVCAGADTASIPTSGLKKISFQSVSFNTQSLCNLLQQIVLRHGHSLHILEFVDCSFEDDEKCYSSLAEAASTLPHLSNFILQNCSLEFKQLSTILQGNHHHLEALQLDQNECGPQTMRCIRSILEKPECRLTHLSMNYCFNHKQIGNEVLTTQTTDLMKELAQGLATRKSLVRLSLTDNRLDDAAWAELVFRGFAIGKNKTVKCLDFQGNDLTDAGLHILTKQKPGQESTIFEQLAIKHLVLYNNTKLSAVGIQNAIGKLMVDGRQALIDRIELPRLGKEHRILTQLQSMLDYYGA